jgi:hypothetical protein
LRQLSKIIHRDALEQQRQAQIARGDGTSSPGAAMIKVVLPIFPFLLVLGLSRLAADEKKRLAPGPAADEDSEA